jgi:DNA-binding MarR family transcriptional regulator
MNDTATTPLAAEAIRTLHSIEGALEAAIEPIGLSLAKFGALSKLVAAGEPLPLHTLAERCLCVRSNITQLVDRLEADGLVSRTSDPNDRRSVRAQLTAEGRARHAAASRALREAEDQLFSHLEPRQREDLLTLLRSFAGRP